MSVKYDVFLSHNSADKPAIELINDQGKDGWIAAKSNFIDCNFDLAALPSVEVDPPPPSSAQTSHAEGGCSPENDNPDCVVRISDDFLIQFKQFENNQELTTADGVKQISFEVRVGAVTGDTLYETIESTFDVVFSHTVLHYFWNPEHALSEQKRVLKEGGWLIAAGVRDPGLVKRYPECPIWDEVLQARIRFSNAVMDGTARFKWDRRPCIAFQETGRMCPEWFARLGMNEIQVSVKPYKLEYPGADGMQPSPHDLLPWDSDDPIGYHAEYTLEYEAMIDQGFLDRETLRMAMCEAKQWFNYPGAFHFHAMILVAGRK